MPAPRSRAPPSTRCSRLGRGVARRLRRHRLRRSPHRYPSRCQRRPILPRRTGRPGPGRLAPARKRRRAVDAGVVSGGGGGELPSRRPPIGGRAGGRRCRRARRSSAGNHFRPRRLPGADRSATIVGEPGAFVPQSRSRRFRWWSPPRWSRCSLALVAVRFGRSPRGSGRNLRLEGSTGGSIMVVRGRILLGAVGARPSRKRRRSTIGARSEGYPGGGPIGSAAAALRRRGAGDSGGRRGAGDRGPGRSCVRGRLRVVGGALSPRHGGCRSADRGAGARGDRDQPGHPPAHLSDCRTCDRTGGGGWDPVFAAAPHRVPMSSSLWERH